MSWRQTTPQYRRGGQWVGLGTGDGGGGGGGGGGTGEYPSDSEPYDFYGPSWVEPPTRSNTAYVSNFNSLQDALSNVNEDTILYLDNGPYTGNVTLEVSNVTVSGEGYDNAHIDFNYNDSSGYGLDTASWNLSGTTCNTFSEGDYTITGVSDTSLFSVGDNVRFWDESDEYNRGNPQNSSSNDSQPKYMINEVVSVGSSSIELQAPAIFDFGGSPEVYRVDWGVENVHFDNLDFAGNGKEYNNSGPRNRLLFPNECKDVWMTNIYCEEIYGMGAGSARSLNIYADGGHSHRTRFYGINVGSGTTNCHVHNWEGTDLARYAMNTGMSTSGQSYYIRGYDCVGRAVAAVGDAHFGSQDVVFHNFQGYPEYSNGASHEGSLHRLRGYDQHGQGGHHESTTGGRDVTHAQQWAEYISYEGATTNEHSFSRDGIILTTADSSWNIATCEVRDCDFYGDGTPFVFHCDVDSLYVQDYYWNGDIVTGSDIEASRGYSDQNVSYEVDNTV